jgi:hypothetical protein
VNNTFGSQGGVDRMRIDEGLPHPHPTSSDDKA